MNRAKRSTGSARGHGRGGRKGFAKRRNRCPARTCPSQSGASTCTALAAPWAHPQSVGCRGLSGWLAGSSGGNAAGRCECGGCGRELRRIATRTALNRPAARARLRPNENQGRVLIGAHDSRFTRTNFEPLAIFKPNSRSRLRAATCAHGHGERRCCWDAYQPARAREEAAAACQRVRCWAG